MSKTIQEQIEVMQHFLNGGEVENNRNGVWFDCKNPVWNWNTNYRIKEKPKDKIVIEKWLLRAGDRKSFFIAEGDKSYLENYNSQVEKVRLLETYEVEV